MNLSLNAWSSSQHICHSDDSITAAGTFDSVFHIKLFALSHKHEPLQLSTDTFVPAGKSNHLEIHIKKKPVGIILLSFIFLSSWLKFRLVSLEVINTRDLQLYLQKTGTSTKARYRSADGHKDSKVTNIFLRGFVVMTVLRVLSRQFVSMCLTEFDTSPRLYKSQVADSATVEESWASTGNGRRNGSVL